MLIRKVWGEGGGRWSWLDFLTLCHNHLFFPPSIFPRRREERESHPSSPLSLSLSPFQGGKGETIMGFAESFKTYCENSTWISRFFWSMTNPNKFVCSLKYKNAARKLCWVLDFWIWWSSPLCYFVFFSPSLLLWCLDWWLFAFAQSLKPLGEQLSAAEADSTKLEGRNCSKIAKAAF